jgi:hypothetical protein
MLFTFFQIKVFWKHLAWPIPKARKEFAEKIIYVSIMCTVCWRYMLEQDFEICEILSVSDKYRGYHAVPYFPFTK